MAVYTVTSNTQIEDGTDTAIDVTNTGTVRLTLSTGDVLRPGQAITICPTGAITASVSPINGETGYRGEVEVRTDSKFDALLIAEGKHDTGTFVPVLNTGLVAWALGQNFRLVSASRDANGAITSASIVWPDGSTGTFTTDTASTAFPGAIDAYHVTYVPSVGSTKTVTQAAVTRDPSTGAVTAQPALAVA